MRNLALTTAAILLTLVCCELSGRALLDPRGFGSRHDERVAFLRRLPLQPDGAARDAAALERVGHAAFSLHPFFGYTFRPSFEGADAQGFYSGSPALPHRAASDELVVGIFGGSVAMQVADARGVLGATLEPAARAAGYQRVTVLSFAIGGWRQPQHFNALVRFLDGIDVAIVLDGFNEVIHLGDWHLARQPAEYPWSAVYGMLARRPAAEETVTRAELLLLHETARHVTAVVDRSALRRSTLVHLLWRVYAARYERSATALRSALAHVAPDPAIQARAGTGPIAARRDSYLEWWHDLILYSDLISRARGRSFFHFVQPNQYDRGSKPLSPEERESFTRNTAWFDEVTPRYARVEEMTAHLRRSGVDSTFLGDLFATTAATVYVDDCCHLNEHGVHLLAAAIGEHVAASGRLGRGRGFDIARARS